MYSKSDLLKYFGSVDEYKGCNFVQLELPAKEYEYCLKSSEFLDLLVICEDVFDRDFAVELVKQAPNSLMQGQVSLFEISPNKYDLTHCLVVPNTYHGALNHLSSCARENLFLCIPIHRCEFSGDESRDEFREMILRTIPVYRLDRKVSPKLIVYFDNPKTKSGTDEDGVLMKYPILLNELDNLNGVASGFIEITNYKRDVVEVLSPSRDIFTLIRNRKDEELLELPLLVKALDKFAVSG
ncbi:hypothetical protein [Pseudomonas alabamensis]|uniref:hypothetical protein n=1 Tax=Pseudomonas alabamensis TaxID=3064349 RepID=UPI0021DAE6D0|nr:hypothetical protein [Pseudomonas entomophila]